MNLVERVENQKIDNRTLGVSLIKFFNEIGHHFVKIRAEVGRTKVIQHDHDGYTYIKLPADATAKDILGLLNGHTDTDISDFGRRLKDVAILLSQEQAVKGSSVTLTFAKQIFAIGSSIRNESVKEDFDLSSQQLSNNSQEYKDELFLWAIGRDNPDSKYARNLHNDKRPHPVDRDYTGDQLTQEQRALKSQRSENTLRHKSLLLKKFVEGLEQRQSELPKETRIGLEKTFISAARQAVISILTKNAWKNWEQNLRIPPPERHKYFDNEILKIFEKIPGFQDESLRIVTAVEELTKSERWKTLSDVEKIRDIWDVCQTYKHVMTWSPDKALKSRKFECQLKSFLSGNLIKKFVPEVKVAAWYEEDHTKLVLKIKKSIYMFDARKQKEFKHKRNTIVTKTSRLYNKKGIGITNEIKQKTDIFFKTHIEQLIPTKKGGYLSLGDFDKTIISGIFVNIDLLESSNPKFAKYMHIALLKLAIEINPNYAEAYDNLGVEIEDLNKKEAIRMYRKAIEINPNFAVAYNNLGEILSGEEAIRMYRKAIEINPNYIKVYYRISDKIRKDKNLQTKEMLELGLKSINKYLELAKVDPKEKTSYYLKYAPKIKVFFDKRLAELEETK